jgi:hypothetical protein
MSYQSRVQNNAREIVGLRQRLDDAIAHRGDDPQSLPRWEEACAEFHRRYELLAFPGGPRNARSSLRAGDQEAIEYALAFLEVRPYFFRSGYMYKDFIRVLRHCPLSTSQRSRHEELRDAYQQYRTLRRSKR